MNQELFAGRYRLDGLVGSGGMANVYKAYDEKAGACVSVLDLFSYPLNHKPHVSGGNLEEESAAILRDFFREKR